MGPVTLPTRVGHTQQKPNRAKSNAAGVSDSDQHAERNVHSRPANESDTPCAVLVPSSIELHPFS